MGQDAFSNSPTPVIELLFQFSSFWLLLRLKSGRGKHPSAFGSELKRGRNKCYHLTCKNLTSDRITDFFLSTLGLLIFCSVFAKDWLWYKIHTCGSNSFTNSCVKAVYIVEGHLRHLLLLYSFSYHLISIPSFRKEMRELVSLEIEVLGVAPLYHLSTAFRELMGKIGWW